MASPVELIGSRADKFACDIKINRTEAEIWDVRAACFDTYNLLLNLRFLMINDCVFADVKPAVVVDSGFDDVTDF